MTGRASSDAARVPRARTEAAQRNGEPDSGTAEQMERELAALKALLTRQLQSAPTRPVADRGSDEGRPRYDAEPRLQRTPPARPYAGTRRQEFRDRPASVPEAELPAWIHRLPDSAPSAAIPCLDRPRRFERVALVIAVVVGMVAVLGLSALVATLIVDGEPPATVTAEDSTSAGPPAEQSILAAQNAPAPPASAERVDAPADTASHASAAVRDADQQVADRFSGVPQPAEGPAVHSEPTAGPPISGAALTPHTAERDSAVGGPFEPATVGTAAPAAQQPAPDSPSANGTAQADAAIVESDDVNVASDDVNVASDDVNVEVAEGTAGEPAQPTRSAAVTLHVNMRASPDNNAAVVAVVPAGRNVGVVGCEQWCEVVYDGQRGFIFRKFVSGAEQ